ncbi:ribose-5-phosphate isomerase [secondary endosymbiont of Heteropsylla cubana]|uniref:Ribose-5-phosphate isomerase A n=1 Tax=secondary endosymbiont of Heteropsylla cubana TaxID=134287 RepID=J3TZ31_9ENTR|nr:ribose-5-phosphate isomerase RpiA [secondary endosymbiont of Heteropsylla cubana]AFP85715.1 ribose-5-phosphate isomerase [secondary endosymbiont of Heteropsylla cubana]
MRQNELKRAVGWAALKYISRGSVIGVGTGSTVGYFIEALSSIKHEIKGAVSSSEESSIKLQKLKIPLFDLNKIDKLDIYIDGADEINSSMHMIKGGGGALTREKIIAAAADKFVCIVDFSKLVNILGTFPLPVEVIPMARRWVSFEINRLGGKAVYRHGVITDNGNVILDVHNLVIMDALMLENKINNIAGVVTVGLFAHRSADIALISSKEGVKKVISKKLGI